MRRCTRGKSGGDTIQESSYLPPKLANPGNLIKIKVGGGQMGHKLAHENEAPFPQALAEWFIRSWCPPGGTVLDPFSGSGTTVAAAMALGRRGVGTDIRLSQCELGRRRCGEIQTEMF
jgi:DNA modification methylase